MNENEITIKSGQENQRLDKFLLKYFNKATPGFIYKMLRKKRIKLNDARANGSELLNAGDRIKFYLSPETMDLFMEERRLPQMKPDAPHGINIVYEDENLLICNKPTGLLSHSGKPGDDTMIDRILLYLHETGVYGAEKGSAFTPALCNRLDRNTSGLVVCGKTAAAVRELNRILAERLVDKWYAAIVCGEVLNGGILRDSVKKDTESNTVHLNLDGEKIAVTEYVPEKSANGFTLLRIKLHTGKTHQIRAQLGNAGHPILGDGKYGDALTNKRYHFNHQLLHAYKLTFLAENGMFAYLYGKEFTAPYPRVFQEALNRLRLNERGECS